ncbi:uncharacterized protein LOC111312150 isoform X3 [Durio zibethinus]|uniref:Uncharacterized protein LOC111312150 isoform X3 n=1 Tax=Durio zibethinus TaxID=66656 RepID=A0A6P6ASV0_DURZI|nr:uncharacterized protein LOC111312150 isoform X3 [Durio zibethinus]
MFWFSLVLSYKPIALTSAHRPGIFPPLPPTTFKSRSSSTCRPCCCTKSDLTKQDEETPEEEETFQVLTAVKSKYNDIVIVDTPKSRMLLLDSTHNVHSVLQKGDEKWTGSYWDEFATLPPIVPEGPIAIYGLGGGTAAHLMLDVWPSLQLQGLKFTLMMLFHLDSIFLQAMPVETWLELSDRLMPDGRLMVNCGGVSESSIDGKLHHQSVDDVWIQNSTIKALAKAFPGQVNWKRMPKRQGQNYLALTGLLPDLTSWSAIVPGCLSESVKQWKPCRPFH